MNTFPLPQFDDDTQVVRARKDYAKHQDGSFWVSYPRREGFTAAAIAHFAALGPPQTARSLSGVTLQAAQRHGVL